MTARSNTAMLELWRPPAAAGDPVGCVTTTFTFTPGLFDEQCLARFLDIESEPDREDLAFLLERETRLGSVYAGVLVDHTRAGVEHSLRWDVLPVRIRGGKQHAKLSLLLWSAHLRIIVASANLTEPGYRTNHEVTGAIDLTPEASDAEIIEQSLTFLRGLMSFVPGASAAPPEIRRLEAFLDQVESLARRWKPRTRSRTVHQQLVCTLPAAAPRAPRSSLEEAIEACRHRGGSPAGAQVASPFFDAAAHDSHVTASLCKMMARGMTRDISFCVPAITDATDATPAPRLAAPKALLLTPGRYSGSVQVKILPQFDSDKNLRPWHAKMLALSSDSYSALMMGSSNFTCAGMGVGGNRNAEANLLTVVSRKAYGRDVASLEAIWPAMESVDDPDSAEWQGPRGEFEEEEQGEAPSAPAGFLLATYRAGDKPAIALRLNPDNLPDDWHVHACGTDRPELLSADLWRQGGSRPLVNIAWLQETPPEKLLVRWGDREAFLPINVEDSRALPPPADLKGMTADDMLWVLAAADPSAAFRAWAAQRKRSDVFDEDLDSAQMVELDPLRRYDLQATFLHRIRRRARILAQLRANLQRPVWGHQALEWRLRGLVGIQPLAERLVKEFATADGASDDALLTLADFLIVLREVDYQPGDGSLPKAEFDKTYKAFLHDLLDTIVPQVQAKTSTTPPDLIHFWESVVKRCRA